MQTSWRTLAFSLLMVMAPAVQSAGQPDVLIKTAVADVLAAYEAGKDQLGADPDFLRGIIEEHVLVHIDFGLMSRLVLGKHWRKASKEQREVFTRAFRERLIRTYSTPLSKYEGQQIKFLPYREGKDPKRATVETHIVPHQGVPIPVSYKLRLQDRLGWKVYDISIDAVSMVNNYRSAYGSEISRKGMAKFISSVSENRSAPAGSKRQ